MTIKIIDNQGTIDKYIGDAIMAFWGAPLEDNDHPIHACRAALTCKQTLDELNKHWVLDRKPAFITRFGIHTGDAIVGNVGSEDRLNYSAFGDSVNLAARLEGINKYYGTTITISHETYKNVQHQFICRPIDVVAVKGKTEGVRIYELLYELSDEHNKSLDIDAAQKLTDITTEAFKAYLAKDWKTAMQKYEDLKELNPNDKVADVFLERCQIFKKTPPPAFWNGTYVMTEK
jgi:adenylate cyclase